MTAPNVNTLWGRVIIDELAKAGIEGVCVAPGSRSTPLTVAAAERGDFVVDSVLDERSAGFYALGRAKRTGEPTPLICTSGTAAAEFHPAVIEADRSRTPMLLLTTDRPPELQDSGANQTVDQTRLYGDAVRWYRTLPEPAPKDRTLRSVRTTVARAIHASTDTHAGPVHLNVPFAKPLSPTEADQSVPAEFGERSPLAVDGRNGPFVRTHQGAVSPEPATVSAIAAAVREADHGLIVAGPDGVDGLSSTDVTELAATSGFPVLADPLSGVRFGPHVGEIPIVGGYDAYLDSVVTDDWPSPDLVLRFGGAPTSQPLQNYLASTRARQVIVDPAGGWREASFVASDLVVAHPHRFVDSLVGELADPPSRSGDDLTQRFATAEEVHWSLVAQADEPFEGTVAATTLQAAPSPSTVFVSNSMPVRDVDRFGRPSTDELTVIGNRGASGIDGITSTAIGAGSATDDPLVLLTGDLAAFHDLTGLNALERCDVDATMVVLNNDGGGIFHQLPIAALDPPFTELFKTPHGLDFEAVADLYDLEYRKVDTLTAYEPAYREALEASGTHLLEVQSDSEASFDVRDRLQAELVERLR